MLLPPPRVLVEQRNKIAPSAFCCACTISGDCIFSAAAAAVVGRGHQCPPTSWTSDTTFNNACFFCGHRQSSLSGGRRDATVVDEMRSPDGK